MAEELHEYCQVEGCAKCKDRSSESKWRSLKMEDIALGTPQEIEQTGIQRGLLEDLALKILYLNGEVSLCALSDRMCLGSGVIEEIFTFFRKEQLCEVKGMAGGSHRIVATAQGKLRACDLLSRNQYVGPAPVSLMDYGTRVRMQSVQQTQVQRADLIRAFHPLILDEDLIYRLGTAVVSGTSIFLHGPAGTGKTSIANSLPAIYKDQVWIPYGVEVDGQIITVYDPGVHRQSEEAAPEESDRRWVSCRRPRVIAGGELSAEMLDLQYNHTGRYYTGPLQMKANNGVLIMDDFGRQRMRPVELFSRWMTPLDRRVDFLTLPGGKKFEVPFDLFVVFATNLDPSELADEAFLRRIPNKIRTDYATPEQFVEIFRRECATRLLDSDAGVPEYLVKLITQGLKQPLSHCYARDLINQIYWAAAYLGVEPRLTRNTLEQACRNYFLSAAKS
jgi:SpoVK/Ycf46/Vps4 family AAA+-type ATPase